MQKISGVTQWEPRAQPKLPDSFYSAARREIQILDCLSEMGVATTKEIARRVGISHSRVGGILGNLRGTCVRYANQKWELLP